MHRPRKKCICCSMKWTKLLGNGLFVNRICNKLMFGIKQITFSEKCNFFSTMLFHEKPFKSNDSIMFRRGKSAELLQTGNVLFLYLSHFLPMVQSNLKLLRWGSQGIELNSEPTSTLAIDPCW